MHRLVVTRFDTKTYQNNKNWKKKHNWKGAAYGTPVKVSEAILSDAVLFVLEMHLDENKIKGIGFIRNNLETNKHFKIYNSGHYNRYTYCSKYRIDRTELNFDEKVIIRVLDNCLFKGSRHTKRGQGITAVPEWLMKNTVINFIQEFRKMFLSRWNNLKSDE